MESKSPFPIKKFVLLVSYFSLLITRTAGAGASPQRPAAVILTASFDMRFYEYMLGVVAIKESEKYSVLAARSSKTSCI